MPSPPLQDSFEGDGMLDCPHYTRPVEHALGAVPEVLLSGNHAHIARWRRMQSLGRTWLRRPDLLDESGLSKADRTLLAGRSATTMPIRLDGPGRRHLSP